MLRRITLLTAALAATLALAGTAAAANFVQGQGDAGNGETAQVILESGPELTTAYAIGVSSTAALPSPVTIQYAIDCLDPRNDTSGSLVLTPNIFEAKGAYLFTANRAFGTPWNGWDSCNVLVVARQAAADDHSLFVWLVSHS